jgi:sulfotransferase family protein
MSPRLPDFVIIGAQKAGTTWLAQRLAEQPGIFLPRPEVHFFDRPDHYAKGAEWYASHFPADSNHALHGEKTPDYFWTRRPSGRGPNDIPERMHRLLPEARMVVVLRDPVKRAISALNHEVRARRMSPFVDPDRVIGQELNEGRVGVGLINRGHYLDHLRRFLAVYPREQIHVVFFEDDIVRAPQDTLNQVTSFLGLKNAAPIQAKLWPENKGMNSRAGLVLHYYLPRLSSAISAIDRLLPESPPISPTAECLARMYDYFRPHNQALFDFLGRRTEAWNGPAKEKGAAPAGAAPSMT